MWLDRGELEKIALRLRELEGDVAASARGRDERPRDKRRPAWRPDEDDDDRRPPRKKRWTEMFNIFHIPPNYVVDQWASDMESSSHRDFLFLHHVWTPCGRLMRDKIT